MANHLIWPGIPKLKTVLIQVVMYNFIDDYLYNPSMAVAAAAESSRNQKWYDNVDEESIYKELASPEYRLYETIIL